MLVGENTLLLHNLIMKLRGRDTPPIPHLGFKNHVKRIGKKKEKEKKKKERERETMRK